MGSPLSMKDSPVALSWAQCMQHSTGFGESYEDNAVRELEEEMGITDACLETLFDFWYSDGTCRLWGRLFRWDCDDCPCETCSYCLRASLSLSTQKIPKSPKVSGGKCHY